MWSKGKVKKAASLLLGLVLAAASGVSALAAPATGTTVTYDGGLQRLTLTGSENLFGAATNLVPGDTVSNTILLTNTGEMAVEFFLKAQPSALESEQGKAESDRLLNALKLDISLRDVDQEGNLAGILDTVYNGPASGNGEQTLAEYVKLGSYDTGEWAVLQLTLSVPVQLDNSYKDALGALDWSFYCVGDTSTTPPGGGGEGSGGGGGTGGGGTGGSDRPDVAGSTLTGIADGEVPLGTVEILDEEAPLSALPKTGGSGQDFFQLWMLPLAVALIIPARAMCRNRKAKV